MTQMSKEHEPDSGPASDDDLTLEGNLVNSINCVQLNLVKPFTYYFLLNGHKIPVEIDSWATASTLGYKWFKQLN